MATDPVDPDAAFPAEFDPVFYRERYGDIARFGDAEALDHYRRHGIDEGRIASAAATREGFLDTVLGRQRGDILEIGPFCSPLLRGPNIAYLDVLDPDGLRARAASFGLDASGCPDTIDYVGAIDDIDRRFDGVVSSHAIEHQPDLVEHLRAVGRLLEPGGHYFLIVPDHRYCFDANIPRSTIAGVMQAHHEKRTRHTLASVIEHRALVAHNDAGRHWAREHSAVGAHDQVWRTQVALDEYAAAAGDYIDVHAWYFTPAGFRDIVAVLRGLGLIELEPLRVYETPHSRFEFCAVLRRAA